MEKTATTPPTAPTAPPAADDQAERDRKAQEAQSQGQGNSSGGFDFGGIISWIVNFIKSIFTGAGSLIQGLISSSASAAPTKPTAPPTTEQGQATTPPLTQSQAQALLAQQNSTAATGAGGPNSVPRQPDTGRAGQPALAR